MQRQDAASPADRRDSTRREYVPGGHHRLSAGPVTAAAAAPDSGLSRLLQDSPAAVIRTDPSSAVRASTTAAVPAVAAVGGGGVGAETGVETSSTRAGRTLLDSPAVNTAATAAAAAASTAASSSSPSVGICPCRTPVLLDMSRCEQTDLDLLDWLDKCVLLVRSVPGLAPLPAADRALLLSAAWKELVILYMAQGRFDFDYLVPAGGLDELARKLSGPGSIPTRHGQCCIHWSWIEGIPTLRSVEQLRFILHKFREIRPDDKEFALLRVLLLFNADLRGLSNSPAVEAANERVHTALMEYENACYPRDPLRLSHLLLLLPGVRGFSSKVFENLFYKHLTRDVNVEGLLTQMLRG